MDIQKLLRYIKPINNNSISMSQSYNIIRLLNAVVCIDTNIEYVDVAYHYLDLLIEDFPEKGVMLTLEKDDVVDKDISTVLHVLQYTTPKNATNLLIPALFMSLAKTKNHAAICTVLSKIVHGEYKNAKIAMYKIKGENE